MALTDVKCRNVRPDLKLQKLSDGGGLQLWVQPTGGRLWRFAYRFGGKQKLLALGSYPAISLADAREAREEARRLLSDGIDPSQAKKEKKAAEGDQDDTFRVIAAEYVSKLKQEGRAEATITKLEWLLDFARPLLGNQSIKTIDALAVLKVLREVETRGRYESARRLRTTLGSVFRYAIATERADADPMFALQGALINPKVTPRAAIIDPISFGALLRAIGTFDGQPSTKTALK